MFGKIAALLVRHANNGTWKLDRHRTKIEEGIICCFCRELVRKKRRLTVSNSYEDIENQSKLGSSRLQLCAASSMEYAMGLR